MSQRNENRTRGKGTDKAVISLEDVDEVLDSDEGHEDEESLQYLGEATFLWSFNAEFPEYLRELRNRAGLSLRKAAKAIGVSYVYLSRLETGGSARPPDMDKLFRMAEVYGVDRRRMLNAAGLKLEVPDEVQTELQLRRRFSTMIMDDALRPTTLDENTLHYIPDRVKLQWIEFAHRLATMEDPAAYLADLIGEDEESER